MTNEEIDALSGRELDKAVEDALGRVPCEAWRRQNFGSAGGAAWSRGAGACEHAEGMCYPAGEIKSMFGSAGGPRRFHSSLDAHLAPGGTVEWLTEHECGEVRLSWHGSAATAWVQLPFRKTGWPLITNRDDAPATALSRAFLRAVAALGEQEARA